MPSLVIHIDYEVYRLLKKIRDKLGLKSMNAAVVVLIHHYETREVGGDFAKGPSVDVDRDPSTGEYADRSGLHDEETV